MVKKKGAREGWRGDPNSGKERKEWSSLTEESSSAGVEKVKGGAAVFPRGE